MKRRTMMILTVLTVLIAFMEISGLPVTALMKGTVAGVDPYIIPLLINFGLIGIVAFAIWKILIEGIVYYLGVGLVEEVYVRGLFLNLIEAVL